MTKANYYKNGASKRGEMCKISQLQKRTVMKWNAHICCHLIVLICAILNLSLPNFAIIAAILYLTPPDFIDHYYVNLNLA
jgi:hypothetical protein